MKYIYLLTIAAILLSAGGCALVDDTPRHTAEEVITITKSFNTQCRLQVGVEEPCG